MQVAISTNFPESVVAGVHATIASALHRDVLPVRDALLLLLSGRNLPIRALVASSLHFDRAAIEAGTALDLIHAGLQRLHARLDATEGAPALLGTAATVLVGDYLTTGAFRLLVRCADMRVLVMVSDAVNRASELETTRLDQDRSDHASPQIRRNLAAPLSEAAGAAGAILAGYPESLAATAKHFGNCLVSSYVLLREVENMAPSQASARLHATARDICQDATSAAEAIASAKKNSRPLELAELISLRINETFA